MKFWKSSSLKLLGQLKLNFAYIVLGWTPFKIVSGNPDIQPTWSLLLKIEMVGWIFFPLKLLGQLDSSFAKIIHWWSPFKFFSGSHVRVPSSKFHSPFLFLVTATMLVGGRDCRTQFWKGIIHGPFHQSLVLSGQVVSEENICCYNCGRTGRYCWSHEFLEMLPRIGNNMHPFFSSPDPKGHVSFCHHFASVVRASTIIKKNILLWNHLST
jgi:hypothetical protein